MNVRIISLGMALCMLIGRLVIAQDVAAQGTFEELALRSGQGTSVSVLARQQLPQLAPRPDGSSWGVFGVGYSRLRLLPGESRSFGGRVPPFAQLVYVDRGAVEITSDGQTSTKTKGDRFEFPASSDIVDRTFSIMNNDVVCASLLVIVTAYCNNCGGGPDQNPTPPAASSAECPEPLDRPVDGGERIVMPASQIIARATIDAGAEWDIGGHFGAVGAVVERGEVILVDSRGREVDRRPGEDLYFSIDAGRMLRNRGSERASVLLFALSPKDPALSRPGPIGEMMGFTADDWVGGDYLGESSMLDRPAVRLIAGGGTQSTAKLSVTPASVPGGWSKIHLTVGLENDSLGTVSILVNGVEVPPYDNHSMFEDSGGIVWIVFDYAATLEPTANDFVVVYPSVGNVSISPVFFSDLVIEIMQGF